MRCQAAGRITVIDMEDNLAAVRTLIIFFKLLDLGKVHRGFRGNGRGGGTTSGGLKRVTSERRTL